MPDLKDIKKLYFIGIGGIGMSALARYFNGRGVVIFGYDKMRTPLTEKLSAEGMTIHYEEDVTQIPEGIDAVVWTPAVPKNHTELTWFRERGYAVMKRSEMLGIISRSMKTIAIAGTHGKTTTTTILTHILRTGGVDCTAFLGGISGNFESNFVEGKSDWVVVEADEFDRSFLQLSPDIALVTSMDADHLDIYGNHDDMLDGFTSFISKVKHGGTAYLKHGLTIKKMPENVNVIENAYGINCGKSQAQNIHVENGNFVFDIENEENTLHNLKFTLPGKHNVENATAAILIARQLGVTDEAIREALATFKGIKRRFETIIKNENITFIDDYAHHPEELKAAIRAAKMLFPNEKITGIFQPHLYTRTRDFADGFAAALDELDEPILLPIYPARELPIEGVNSEMIFNKMKNLNKKITTKEVLFDILNIKKIKVLLTLGAGDIDALVPKIVKQIENISTK